MKIKIRKVISLLLICGIMGLIYYFSDQNGIESSNISNNVLHLIEKLLKYKITYIRKLAHFSLYFGLGLSFIAFFGCFIRNSNKIVLYTLFLTQNYAMLDELHQTYILGRSGNIYDVFIDMSGVILAIFIYKFFRKIFRLFSKK